MLLLAGRGAVVAVEELLRLGASIHKADRRGEGFLFHALHASDQFERLAALFVAHSGNINAANSEGVS